MSDDLNKNYYKFLGLTTDANEEEIRIKIIELHKELNNNPISQEYFIAMINILAECEKVLLTKSNRIEYDKSHGFNNMKNIENDETIKVVNVEENIKTEEQGKNAVVAITTIGLVIIMLGSVITGRLWSEKVNDSKKKSINDKSTTLASLNGSSTAMTINNNTSSNIASTEKDSINEVSADIWNEVKNLQNDDENYVPNLTENNIINLVRWARHNGVVISNKEAYVQLMDLASNPEFNIAEFTKGTDDYNELNSYIKCFDDIKENNTLIDEDQCIKKIGKIDLNRDSVVSANIAMAEVYTKINEDFELDMATNMGEGVQDANMTKTLKTLSTEEIMNNYETYNEFINSFNDAIDKSDQEDSSLKK